MVQSGPHVQLMLKWTKREKMKEKKRKSDFSHSFGSGRERVRGERKKSSFSLRSTEIWWSEFVEPRFKVHLLDEGYAWVPTTRSFTEDFGFGEENLMREALPSL